MCLSICLSVPLSVSLSVCQPQNLSLKNTSDLLSKPFGCLSFDIYSSVLWSVLHLTFTFFSEPNYLNKMRALMLQKTLKSLKYERTVETYLQFPYIKAITNKWGNQYIGTLF